MRYNTILPRHWCPPPSQKPPSSYYCFSLWNTQLNNIAFLIFFSHIHFYLLVVHTAADECVHERIATRNFLISNRSLQRDDGTTHIDDGKAYTSRTIRLGTTLRRHWSPVPWQASFHIIFLWPEMKHSSHQNGFSIPFLHIRFYLLCCQRWSKPTKLLHSQDRVSINRSPKCNRIFVCALDTMICNLQQIWKVVDRIVDH